MTAEIDDAIDVVASFGRSGFQPRLFLWEKRRYPIAKITATWAEPAGLYRRHHFAVLAGANLYELCFFTRDLTWRLIRVEMD